MIEINGMTVATDKEGYLQERSQWSPEVAALMAKNDRLELGKEHWLVINFIRQFYDEFGLAPPIRVLVRSLHKVHGSTIGNSRHLNRLFPLGPAKQASRYAGLPKPVNCI